MRQRLKQAGHLIKVTGFVGLAFMAACQSPAGKGSGQPIVTTASSPAPTRMDQATSTAMPMNPPRATSAPTVAAPPSPTSILTSTPTGFVSSNDQPADPPVTDTPPPTFTPPPPPPSIDGEHLWLQRPVLASAPSWTDKAYPYGSTRGGMLRPHTGVEFLVPQGTPVLAAAAGTVVAAGDDATVAFGPQTDFYGRLVIIELDTSGSSGPLFTLYGHLSEVSVVVGQSVAAGDVIGLSGASGVADGPHLHFEVRAGQNSYDATRNPLLWLTPLNGSGVVAGRVVGSGGELLYEAPITLIRVDAPSPYTATTSYAAGEPNADNVMGENFAVDDVVPGFYQVVVDTGTRRFTSDVWVYPGRTNWVEIVVGP